MEEHIYYNNLFDCYSDLLTENEVDCFKSYYEEDLTLSEIALNNNVSRAAIHKTVKNVLNKLEIYENSLHLYEIKNTLQESLSNNNVDDIHKIIEKLLDM